MAPQPRSCAPRGLPAWGPRCSAGDPALLRWGPLMVTCSVDHQLRQWSLIHSFALSFAGVVFDIAECTQVIGVDLVTWLEELLKEQIEETDELRLTAEVCAQRQLRAGGFNQGFGHLPKHIDIGATEAVNRLFGIADDEEVGIFTVLQRQPIH